MCINGYFFSTNSYRKQNENHSRSSRLLHEITEAFHLFPPLDYVQMLENCYERASSMRKLKLRPSFNSFIGCTTQSSTSACKVEPPRLWRNVRSSFAKLFDDCIDHRALDYFIISHTIYFSTIHFSVVGF